MQPLRETCACGDTALNEADERRHRLTLLIVFRASVTPEPRACGAQVVSLHPEITSRTTGKDGRLEDLNHIRNGGAQITKA